MNRLNSPLMSINNSVSDIIVGDMLLRNKPSTHVPKYAIAWLPRNIRVMKRATIHPTYNRGKNEFIFIHV